MLGPHQKAIIESGRVDDVTRAEWRGAKAADRAERRAEMRGDRPIRAARIAPRRFPSPAHCIAAMAELMALRAAVDGSCGEQDLRCAGFSAAEIATHGEAAQVMAAAWTRDRVAA
jgi:hypothetical protein